MTSCHEHAFCVTCPFGGNPLVTGGGSPHKRPIMRYLHVPYFRKPNNNLLNKQSSYWWFKTPRRSTDATVMQDLPYRIHKLTIQYKLGGIYQEMSKLLFYFLLLFYFIISFFNYAHSTLYCILFLCVHITGTKFLWYHHIHRCMPQS